MATLGRLSKLIKQPALAVHTARPLLENFRTPAASNGTRWSLDRRIEMLKRLIPLAMLALAIAISGSSCDTGGQNNGGGSQQSEPSGGGGDGY